MFSADNKHRGKMQKDTSKIKNWFEARVPHDWYALEHGFAEDVEVLVDREEIVVVGPLAAPDAGEDAQAAPADSARRAAVKKFRKDTRERRMEIAEEAQEIFGRHVAWGALVGSDRYLFTHLSVPAMTRMKITERQVLDTLVDAGVASSRSEALAWCVRYVGKKEEAWLDELGEAFKSVAAVRSKGPE